MIEHEMTCVTKNAIPSIVNAFCQKYPKEFVFSWQ